MRLLGVRKTCVYKNWKKGHGNCCKYCNCKAKSSWTKKIELMKEWCRLAYFVSNWFFNTYVANAECIFTFLNKNVLFLLFIVKLLHYFPFIKMQFRLILHQVLFRPIPRRDPHRNFFHSFPSIIRGDRVLCQTDLGSNAGDNCVPRLRHREAAPRPSAPQNPPSGRSLLCPRQRRGRIAQLQAFGRSKPAVVTRAGKEWEEGGKRRRKRRRGEGIGKEKMVNRIQAF